MRYGTEHKAATRQQVIETAARRFRADGIEATGIAALMAEAGLTHGGFYAHFPSKEVLVQETIATALEQTTAKLAAITEKAEGGSADGKVLEKFIRNYLSPAHRDSTAKGCAVPALAAEIARHPVKTRNAFTRELQKLLQMVGDLLPPRLPPAKRQETALALFSTLTGSLQLARAVSDPDLSRHFLEQGIAAARVLVAAAETTPAKHRKPRRSV